MLKKIASFFKFIFVIALLAGGAMLTASLTMISLEVHCDLQDEQVYTCQSRDMLFGWTLSEVTADQVYGIERDLTCKGSGPNKGCSARAEFKTSSADRIVLSRRYNNPDQVQKVVNALGPLMEGKSTPIDMVFPPSTFVSVVMITIGACMFVLLLFVVAIQIFGKTVGDPNARVIDLRRKN